MCVTAERNSTICGHRKSFTEKCKKETCTSFLGHFHQCSPVLNSTYNHELCHDCRHFWRNHRVSENEAAERMMEYRTDHNYYAPLSPERVLFHNGGRRAAATPERLKKENQSKLTLWPEGDVPLEYDGWTEIPLHGSGQAPVNSDMKGKGIDRSIHPLTYRAVENASQATIWPSLPAAEAAYIEFPLPQALPQAYHTQRRTDSNQTGLGTIVIGLDNLPNSDDFEIGNVDRPLPLRANKEGFQRQKTYFAASMPERPAQPKIRLDLDKPLPRPPRADSPMPGRPFDSQNPERDLSAKMYYPRFI